MKKHEVENLTLSIEMSIISLKSCKDNEIEREYKRLSDKVQMTEKKLETMKCRSKAAVDSLCQYVSYAYKTLLEANERIESLKIKNTNNVKKINDSLVQTSFVFSLN